MSEDAKKILVWDAPVRVFHWLLVFSFAGAYLTAESERWRLMHISLGYTMGGLVAFRLLWGVLGPRYARFASFVRGPDVLLRYVRTVFTGKPEHHVGHNPAGAVAIVLLLSLGLATVATGWANDNDLGGNLMENLHELVGNGMFAVVIVHIAGAIVTSLLHRENLVLAMVTGKKTGSRDQAISRPSRPVAIIILVAVVGFWWWQWQGAPHDTGKVASAMTVQQGKHGGHRHDEHD